MSDYLEQMEKWAEARKANKNAKLLRTVYFYLQGLDKQISKGEFNRWQIQTKLQTLMRGLDSKSDNYMRPGGIVLPGHPNQRGEQIISKQSNQKHKEILQNFKRPNQNKEELISTLEVIATTLGYYASIQFTENRYKELLRDCERWMLEIVDLTGIKGEI